MIFLLIFFLLSPTLVQAVDFRLIQNITYTVDQKGDASVVEDNELINNYSEIYAQEYVFATSQTNLQNISANDQHGNILDHVQTAKDSTKIFLKFNQPSLGKDKSTKFTIRHTQPQLSINKGNTWEVTLPGFSTNPGDSINLTLLIPKSFGDIAFSSIPGITLTPYNQYNQIVLRFDQFKNQKVVFSFGPFQLFDFNLTYYLQNPSTDKIQTEIPLPPDTESQTIIFKNITPRPVSVTPDSDGNWLAQYFLDPKQVFTVTVDGQAKITSAPQPSDSDPVPFLQEKPYWPVSHPTIQKLARELKTPKRIFDYVVDNLEYDYGLIDSPNRQGALMSLQSPQNALCTEFTDLFITLARAAAIPAREIEGFAYTNNPKIKPTNVNADILHAWPQYYDSSKKTWIQVDPTWTKTTNGIDFFSDLDLNHLIFVIHGHDSQYPPPPGSYKQNKSQKSVNVSFASQEIFPNSQSPKLKINSRLGYKSQLIISNPNLNSLKNIKIKLPLASWTSTIKTLAPLSSAQIPLPETSFFQSLLPNNQKLVFTLELQNQPSATIPVLNLEHFYHLSIAIGILIVLLCLGGIIITVPKKPNKT